MFTTLKIGEKELNLVANAATAYRYKQVFNEDLLVFFSGLYRGQPRFYEDITEEEKEEKLIAWATEQDSKNVDVSTKLAYIMSLQEQKNDFTHVNMETFLEWLDQFETGDLVRKSGEIVAIFYGNQKTLSTPKKKADQQKER